jgi:hypothetical protein
MQFLPLFEVNNRANVRLSYSELLRYYPLTLSFGTLFSDFFHLCLTQFGLCIAFACRAASLLYHVFLVFISRAQPKVRRIYARSVISIRAIVQHAKSIGIRTEVNQPTYNVGLLYVSLNDAFPDAPVTVARSGGPEPARLSKSNLGKEPTRQREGKTLLQEVLRSNGEMLNFSHSELGHALGCFSSARALLFLT